MPKQSRVPPARQEAATSHATLTPSPSDFLLGFAAKAREWLDRQGVNCVGSQLYDWQSTEDPSWRQLVLDLTVVATPNAAMDIWDDLSEQMYEAIDREPPSVREVLRDRVSLAVKWKQTSGV